ncbi:MAG: adenylate/guanylate cyclase domain-containing protein, partial [Actinomycetota bacterium]|nr:adenylate/guanylate cyclase domain-containing protein [Actinomycetota bacterium]
MVLEAGVDRTGEHHLWLGSRTKGEGGQIRIAGKLPPAAPQRVLYVVIGRGAPRQDGMGKDVDSGILRTSLWDDAWLTADQPAPPSGTVTFLFTDVEGSTRLWDAEPDEMAAAQELIASLADVVWPTSVPLRVRVGAHTGEAQERDGDYFGPAMNRAARVMGAGHGGQILVSETTAGVVGDIGRRLGDFVLRGFAEPVGIFQVGGAEFPPLRISEMSVGNLPRPAGELVGRVGEVAEVAGSARLLSCGFPGWSFNLDGEL